MSWILASAAITPQWAQWAKPWALVDISSSKVATVFDKDDSHITRASQSRRIEKWQLLWSGQEDWISDWM